MATIRQAETKQDLQHARELVSEYLHWMALRLAEEYDRHLDVEAWVEETMTEMASQPGSHLALAYDGAEIAGMGCLRKIGDEMGEIIRLYVRPAFRRKGIGREILECLLQEARAMGYTKIRLGTNTNFMKAAQYLYRSYGFREIAVYPESEIFPEEWMDSLFFEKDLEE
jgi:ribosomal protein S18 acetylase RimI-like enzyme